MQCDICDYKQRRADRYCAGCGATIAGHAPSYESDEPIVFDLDDTINDDSIDDDEQAVPGRDSLVGLAVLALLVAIVALAVTVGGSDADSEVERPKEDVAPPEEIVALPGETEPTPSGEGARIIRPTPTPLPDLPPPPAELIDSIGDLELGTGWLVTVSNERFPIAYNLESGEQIELSKRVSRGTGAFLTSRGAYSKSNTYDSRLAWLGAWSQDEEAEGFSSPQSEAIAATFTDPEKGVIVISVPVLDSVEPEITATVLATGETQIVPGAVDAVAPVDGLDFLTQAAITRASLAPVWVTPVAGTLWRWDWDDGWAPLVDGSVVAEHGDAVVVQRCATPSECRFERVGYDGTLLGEVPVSSSIAQTTFSPDGSKAVRSLFQPAGATVTIIDVTTGESVSTQSQQGNLPLLSWSPNGRYLFSATLFGTVDIIDVETGDLALRFEPDFGSSASPHGFHPVAFFETLERS